jgi:CII-binding regulator of phage lambda lysogenization HflD
MLSGGAIGLALVIVGSVLIGRYSMARLFRYWLALLVAEHRLQTDRLIDAVTESRGAR